MAGKFNLKKFNSRMLLHISVLLVAILTFVLFAGCYLNLVRTEQVREKIGTYVSVVIYATTEQNPDDIIDDAFGELDRLSGIFSNYDAQSSISILNNQGYINNPPAELIDIIELSVQYNSITKGVFEITVNPVLMLWSEGLWEETEDIQEQKVNEALKYVDSGMIEIKPGIISFKKDGMSATLGGVAKGYIVDKMLQYLKSRGIKNAIINAGGDIATMGKKPDGGKWVVSLENPDNNRQKLVTFALEDMAIATSGNYYRYFDPEKKVSHIIDPRTGYSSNLCISSTIVAENATVADILATAVFVLGPEEGMQLVESLDNTEALIIDNNRNIMKSSGIDMYIK